MSALIGTIVSFVLAGFAILGLVPHQQLQPVPQLPQDNAPQVVQQTYTQPTNAITPSNSAQEIVSVPGMSKYTDANFGFSFWYPSGWQVLKHPSGSGSFSPMTVDLLAPRLDGGNIIEVSILELDQKPNVSSSDDFFITLGPQKVLSVFKGSTESTVDPSYLVATIHSTNSTTLKSQTEQIKTLQAERQAYAGQ